jgi:hypothetical protein
MSIEPLLIFIHALIVMSRQGSAITEFRFALTENPLFTPTQIVLHAGLTSNITQQLLIPASTSPGHSQKNWTGLVLHKLFK